MQILENSAQTRRALIGTPEEVAEDIRQYQKLGVTHLVFTFRTRKTEEAVETIERFATQVRPLVA
jgi:alkanesulfonate monooxygenase SsuD/methylene tetrahydromethanopterin reductase-like flavin-dependent oxidoreductase (luciferase family)